jgi:hypothetical protein
MPMITARSYYENVAKATVIEFQMNNSDLRLALLASIAVLHVVDYVMHNREPDPEKANKAVHQYNETTSEKNFAFCVVRGFALASKHCRRRGGDFHSGKHMSAYPSFAGVMRAGQSFFGDKTGGITIQWKEHQWVNLRRPCRRSYRFWRLTLPNLPTDSYAWRSRLRVCRADHRRDSDGNRLIRLSAELLVGKAKRDR